MTESGGALRQPGPRGCLGTAAGLAVLAVMSPFALIIQSFRRWRRGDAVRVAVAATPRQGATNRLQQRIDATIDVPLGVEVRIRRKLTDAIVRIAEDLRRPDDVYNMVYRMPSDEEAVTLPVGPQLQELGERFFLVLNQGNLTGRTVVWLTLGRGTALARVADPVTYDPEAEGQPDGLLGTVEARWSMASEWARVGPSLIIRLILVVPASAEAAVSARLAALARASHQVS